MDEHEALVQGVLAAPNDDLPRLILADWLEEQGDPDYARFIRLQVELAHTPPWEPFAVRCRHQEPEARSGAPWWSALPRLDGSGLEWHPDYAFRRGLGWALIVRDMATLFAEAPRLFDQAPIGQLHLPNATLADWRRFAEQPWLAQVRSLWFYSLRTPIEPLRFLGESPHALGLEEMVFDKASSLAMPELVADLLRSPPGRRLRRLELRTGPDTPDAVDDLLDAVASTATRGQLERLLLGTMPAGERGLELLYASPGLERLSDFELRNVPGARLPATPEAPRGLTCLRASGCRLMDVASLAEAPAAQQLRAIDLSDNPIIWEPKPALVELTGLRSLSLRRTMMLDPDVSDWLTQARFWSNLVELDLRDNRLTDLTAEHLLAAPEPPELTALLLSGNAITTTARDRLRERFGDRVMV